MIIDTHTHLNDDRFPDYEEIINGLQENNLEKIIIASYDFSSSKKALNIAERFKNVYCVIGMHPHDSRLYSDEMENWMTENSLNKKVVGIGEIGLDYFYDLSDRETQKAVFIRQLILADRLNLPIVIHLRDAFKDMLDILNSHRQYLNHGGIIHCYSGSLETAQELISLGFSLGFGGVITYKNSVKSAEVIKNIPLERIVVETDCPYLTPQLHRGERNQPAYCNEVVDKISEILNIKRDVLEEQLLINTYNIFPSMKEKE